MLDATCLVMLIDVAELTVFIGICIVAASDAEDAEDAEMLFVDQRHRQQQQQLRNGRRCQCIGSR